MQGIGTKVDLDENGVPVKYYVDDTVGTASGVGPRGITERVKQGIDGIVNQIKKVVAENNVTISSITFDCFGFSRGAAAARHFANEVLKPEKKETYTYEPTEEDGIILGDTSKPITITKTTPLAGYLGEILTKNNIEIPKIIDVRYIGLFETVESIIFKEKWFVGFWLAFFNPADSMHPVSEYFQILRDVNLSLKNIKGRVNHITAMTEYRKNFPLTISDAPNQSVLQLYGAHSDVGGGYAETYYNTIIGFQDVANNAELDNLKKVVDSYRKRFARVINEKGVFAIKENQIELKKKL